jgi:ureidoglycolate lyase
MREVTVQELTPESFAKYGEYADMLKPEREKIGEAPIEFFRDMVPLNLATTRTASFSICKVGWREPVVDVTEYHSVCEEGNVPLDRDVLMHFAPATPNDVIPWDRIEVFRIPRGTFVTTRPGVWHHAPFLADRADGAAHVLVVLPERTYANDCYVEELPEEQRTRIRL